MTIMYAANFFLCGIMMSLMIAGIIISAITPDMEKWKRKFFIALFTILTLLVSTYLINSFTLLSPNAQKQIFLFGAHRICCIFNFAFNNSVYRDFLLYNG